MGVINFLSSTSETKELHSEMGLRTRYYKTSYAKSIEQVIPFLKKHGYELASQDDYHGELFFKKNNHHLIISIIQINPRETSIDIKVQFYGLFGFNRPKNVILKVYNHLNQVLPFIGTSLHP
jgi:hypothetical protein